MYSWRSSARKMTQPRHDWSVRVPGLALNLQSRRPAASAAPESPLPCCTVAGHCVSLVHCDRAATHSVGRGSAGPSRTGAGRSPGPSRDRGVGMDFRSGTPGARLHSGRGDLLVLGPGVTPGINSVQAVSHSTPDSLQCPALDTDPVARALRSIIVAPG